MHVDVQVGVSSQIGMEKPQIVEIDMNAEIGAYQQEDDEREEPIVDEEA